MKKIWHLCFLVSLLLLLTSCVDPVAPDDSIALVIIAGRHANANLYNLNDKAYAAVPDLISKAIAYTSKDNGGYHAEAQVSIIVSDGAPRKVDIEETGDFRLSFDGNSDRILTSKSKNTASNIQKFLTSKELIADDEGVALLEAIGEARRILENYPSDMEKHILILDTGIPTDGVLKMQSADLNIREHDVEDVLSKLNAGAFPDLQGIKVTFLGLGNVADPQEDLRRDEKEPETAQQKLVNLWTAIITEKCGGTLTEDIKYAESYGKAMRYSEDYGTRSTFENGEPIYPYVDTVALIHHKEIVPPPPPDNDPVVVTPPQPVPRTFHTQELGFKANSAEFRNGKEQAFNTIKSDIEDYKRYLAYDESYRVYVIGSIARTEPDAEYRTSKVSEARAAVVTEILVEMGIPESQIVTIDAGATEFTWRNAKEFNNKGEWQSEEAQKNRVVRITCLEADIEEVHNKGY